MSFTPTNPTTDNLCGTFTDPTTRDPGEAFSAPVSQSCEAPTDSITDDVAVVFVDGEPYFGAAPAESGGSADSGMSYAEFSYVGEAVVSRLFGFFEAPAACRVLGIQIEAQVVPVGGSLTLILVDDTDAEIAGTTATLASATRGQYTEFATALSLVEGDSLSAKIKTVGSTIAGGYLNVRLVIGPAT